MPGIQSGVQNMCGYCEWHGAISRAQASCRMPQLPAYHPRQKTVKPSPREAPLPSCSHPPLPKRNLCCQIFFSPLLFADISWNNSRDSVPHERCLNWFSLSSDLARNHVQFALLHCLQIKGLCVCGGGGGVAASACVGLCDDVIGMREPGPSLLRCAVSDSACSRSRL